jgi:polyhydroxyalkanoate synthesis regulator phasin
MLAIRHRSSHVAFVQIPSMIFGKDRTDDSNNDDLVGRIDVDDELAKSFYGIHKTVDKKHFTPKRFLMLIEAYRQVYLLKKRTVGKRQQHLKSGVAKLNEARTVVDDLKRNAQTKKKELAVKQQEADDALKQITRSMSVSFIDERHTVDIDKHA